MHENAELAVVCIVAVPVKGAEQITVGAATRAGSEVQLVNAVEPFIVVVVRTEKTEEQISLPGKKATFNKMVGASVDVYSIANQAEEAIRHEVEEKAGEPFRAD